MAGKHWLFLLSLALLAACASVDDKSIETVATSRRQATLHGSAPIVGGDLEGARRAAIDNAIAQASEQLRRDRVESLLAGDIKVVDEWQEGGAFHVQAVAVLSRQKSCQAPYRKKILVTAFPAVNTEQISGTDSQDLYGGIPREIANRLMESGDFIARNMTKTSLYDRPDLAPEIPPSEFHRVPVLLTLARQQDVQLVLAGVIRDFRIEATEYVRGSGILAAVKSVMRDYIARRSIGVDVYVYDGFTGALLFQHRYTDSILGDVSLPQGYTVGSERFESSPAGHKISEIIQQASEDIQQLFACHPFSARVERVGDNRVVIAAGAQDGIRAGDRMTVYSAGDSDTAGMGFTRPIASIVISEVGPSMSAGQLEDSISPGMVRPGDWVRTISTP